MKDQILLFLTEKWCDWEAGYAIAVANSFSDYQVKTISSDTSPKTSMGGLKAHVDFTFNGYEDFGSLAMLIIPGGLYWESNPCSEEAEFVKKADFV